jgi:hypothetical protein
MVQHDQLIRFEGACGVGVPGAVAKLDLERIRPEVFDDGANLPANQSRVGQFLRECDDV